MKLGELLNAKDIDYRLLVTVGQDETVSTAIKRLVEHDRGSLPVCDDKGDLVGIVTERDILRRCFARNDSPVKVKMRDIMTKEVIIGTPEHDLYYAISVMKQKRIRHLPIVDKKKVVGMISMRDLLGVRLEEYQSQVHLLNHYISGNYR